MEAIDKLKQELQGALECERASAKNVQYARTHGPAGDIPIYESNNAYFMGKVYGLNLAIRTIEKPREAR